MPTRSIRASSGQASGTTKRASTLGPLVPDLSSRLVDLTLGEVVDALIPYLHERQPGDSANDADAAIDRAGAARWLGVSLAKLDGLIREDATFPVHRVGEVRRFFVSELRAWVLARKDADRSE